jgi:hypothetical protein
VLFLNTAMKNNTLVRATLMGYFYFYSLSHIFHNNGPLPRFVSRLRHTKRLLLERGLKGLLFFFTFC